MAYLCVYAAIEKEPLEYSLMVESSEAMVLSMNRFNFLTKIPDAVLNNIVAKSPDFERWIQEHATHFMMTEYPSYLRD